MVYTNNESILPDINYQRELDVISSTMRSKANIGAGAMLTLFENWNPLTDSIKLLTNALTV